MQIIDQKTTYHDDQGKPLSAGSLLVYKYGTTDLADIYSDHEYTAPVLNPFTLTSAGWPDPQIYTPDSVTVHVRDYLDNDVKVYDVIAGTSGTGGDTGIYVTVDTIEDLRALEPVAEALVAVKGYYDVADCYVREYIFVEDSVLIDNGGTVIQSAVLPTGRWILQLDDDKIDVRAFGVIAGIDDVNSQMRAVQGWASDNDRVVYIPKGTYNYAAGGTFDCYAALDVDEDVKFNRGIYLDPVEANWYKWNLYNPNTRIRSSLAGVCVRLTINGEGWENTIIPVTAFDNSNCRGYSHGSANYHLFFNTNNQIYRWEQNCTLSTASVSKGYTANQYIHTGVSVHVDHLEGEGKIAFNQTTDTWFFRELRTKLVSLRTSYAMARTSDVIYLDSAVVLHTDADITAYVEASGAGTLNTTDGSCKMRGGYGGKPNFILSGYGLDVGYHTIRQDYFSSANGLVNTWNLSAGATGILDMGRAVSTETVSRTGIIYNGTIGGVSAGEITLDNVTVNGNVESTYINAKYTTINGSLPNLASSKFNNVNINTTSTITCTNGVWREVNIPNGNISSIGGSFRLRDVFTKNATFIPNASKTFGNASWIGGSATGITFDATQMSVDGGATGFNIQIEDVIYLPNNIIPVNSVTKYWNINGHYNVSIKNNEGINTNKTEGSIFALLNWRYNQLNSNSTLAGWDMSVYGTGVFRFNDGTNSEGLQFHYLSAEKASDTPANQFGFFPANQFKPYPMWQVVPCMQMRGNNIYFRFYVNYTDYYSSAGIATANPGTVDAQHYCVNFKIYP